MTEGTVGNPGTGATASASVRLRELLDRGAWEELPELPAGASEETLARINRLLRETWRARDAAHDWLDHGARFLGNATPASVLDRGGETAVEGALIALGSGIFI